MAGQPVWPSAITPPFLHQRCTHTRPGGRCHTGSPNVIVPICPERDDTHLLVYANTNHRTISDAWLETRGLQEEFEYLVRMHS